MDALQKVFDTIMEVLNIIKKFFSELFPPKDETEGDDVATPEE